MLTSYKADYECNIFYLGFKWFDTHSLWLSMIGISFLIDCNNLHIFIMVSIIFRHSKSSSSVEKSERRRSRNTSGQDNMPKKDLVNRSTSQLTDEVRIHCH